MCGIVGSFHPEGRTCAEDVVVRNIVASMPNSFRARVAEIEFLGSFCRVGLAINGGDPALVADFSINVVRDLLSD